MTQQNIETMNIIIDLVAGGKKISRALGDVYEKRCIMLPFMDSILDDPIENMKMSQRTTNALMRAKLRSIGDVISYSDGGDFARIRNFGRLYSRSEAKQLFTVDEYAKEMQGIFSSCINASTLDEAPVAYKDYQEIMECIEPTVEILDRLIPIFNFKASD